MLCCQFVDHSQVEAASIYKSAATNSGIDNRSLVVYTDYFFSTFMKHYRLYQHVFTTKRSLRTFVNSVAVEPPLPSQELQLGKIPVLHDYDQKLRELQAGKVQVDDVSIQPLEKVEVQLDDDLSSCPQTQVMIIQFREC